MELINFVKKKIPNIIFATKINWLRTTQYNCEQGGLNLKFSSEDKVIVFKLII